MFALDAFARLIDGLRTAQARRRSDEIIRNLPPEIRKDIGWPDLLTARMDMGGGRAQTRHPGRIIGR